MAGRGFLGFLRSRDGNFATMAALAAPLMIVLGAVAVDEGALYTERREVQALADLAAIAGAANIQKAEKAVRTILADNGMNDVIFLHENLSEKLDFAEDRSPRAYVEIGRYEPDQAVSPALRFTTVDTPFNAVRVTLYTRGTRYFSSDLIPAPTIAAVGVASAPAEAAFSIGSRLVRLDGGLLNQLLGKLAGGNVNLSVMDYQALVDADISAFSFLEALDTRLKLKAATFNEVLKSDASVADIAAAAAAVPGMSRRAQLAAEALAGSASPQLSLPLSKFIDLGAMGQLALGKRSAGFDARISAMDMLSGALAVADGNHQVSLDLGAAIPGLASTKIDLAIGEPMQNSPWFRVGDEGAIVRTAQTRLLLTAQFGGAGAMLGTTITIPIYAEAAYAEGQLALISCVNGNPATAKVVVAAQPGIAELRIANIAASSLSDFRITPPLSPAALVKTSVLTVTGQSLVSMENTAPARLSFNKSEISEGDIKTVSTQDYVSSALNSLVGNLSLNVNVAGLGVGLGTPGAIQSALKDSVLAVTPALDNILYTTLSTLGVKLGEADVRVTGVNCGRSVLVQ